VAAESLAAGVEIDPPPGGLVAVENFTVFEACCRGEVEGVKDAMVVWTAGYPGRAVRALVQAASRTGTAIRVWADLDLDGVRIVRLVAGWIPGAIQPFGMLPEQVVTAPVRRPLTARAASAIRADLAARPTAMLADTLRALLAHACWVEQEAVLGSSS
jgi:hypothetical protein